MKKQYLISILALCAFILISKTILAQMPLPCVEYTNDNVTTLYGFHGSKSVGCMEINMEETPIHMNDDDVRDYQVQNASIKAGYSYVPSGDNGRFSITLGEREEMEGAWFEPINYFPQLYEKIEWGLKLPAEVEQAIDNWISNDQYGTEHYPTLNPFDPEQIDAYATIDYYQDGNWIQETIYGFFFKDYEWIYEYDEVHSHNPNNLPDMNDPDNWFRQELPTEYRFRFRWAAIAESEHIVSLHLNVPSMGAWELSPFSFQSFWGDPKKSFITKTFNNRYFATSDGEVFFPVGQNLFPQDCQCLREFHPDRIVIFDNPNCEECYPMGGNDPCCGLDEFPNAEGPPYDWRGSFWRQERTTIELSTEHIASYLRQQLLLEQLASSGANSYRTILTPISYDFEFEKLNNYYDRQFMAWELDELIQKTHALGLRVELNMMLHGRITHGDRNRWDWTDFDNPTSLDPIMTGYCYYTERALTNCDSEPASFFRETEAKKFYKRKLRYFIARYGYSPNIFLIDLISEINKVGQRDSGSEFFSHLLDEPETYDDSYEVRKNVGDWQIEMAEYIKNQLGHSRHLIAADYAGQAMWTPYQSWDGLPGLSLIESTIACEHELFDKAWSDESIDVMAYSNYRVDLDTYQQLCDLEHRDCQWNATHCSPNNAEYPGSAPFELVNKPLHHAETGGYHFMDIDDTYFEKNLWVNGFSGNASSGFEWGKEWYSERWQIFGRVKGFFENYVFSDPDTRNFVNWQPRYSMSNEGENGSNVTHWSEAVYQFNTSPDNESCIGILMNRTWNLITTFPENTPLGGSMEEGEVLEYFTLVNSFAPIAFPFVEVSYEFDDAPTIDGMGINNNYVILYIDPSDFSLIGLGLDNSGAFGRIKLKDFPTLTYDRPYVLFQIFKVNQILSNNIHEEYKSLIQSLAMEDTEDIVSIEPDLNRLSISIAPNPVHDNLYVNCPSPIEYVEIRNTFGQIVLTTNNIQQEIFLKNLSAGVYFLKVQLVNHTAKIFQIIKQ
ncbi:MAG: T9SS type A sorting domain-containing protein [Flavobacteriales bacterium]|nr:T9SS type A sorting domain-containing protein [Flavobacteriales bacterium]